MLALAGALVASATGCSIVFNDEKYTGGDSGLHPVIDSGADALPDGEVDGGSSAEDGGSSADDGGPGTGDDGGGT